MEDGSTAERPKFRYKFPKDQPPPPRPKPGMIEISPHTLVLRRKQVCHLLNCGLATLNKIRATDPSFPKPFRMVEGSARTMGWLAEDIRLWVQRKALQANLEIGS